MKKPFKILALVVFALLGSLGFAQNNTFTLQDTVVRQGQICTIHGIMFKLGKAELMPESYPVLDSVYRFVHRNPNMVFEISAHLDSRASNMCCSNLSQERAINVVNYLIEKGESPSRLVSKGYGKHKLKITDQQIAKAKTKEEKEALHALNRRIEIKILSINYDATLDKVLLLTDDKDSTILKAEGLDFDMYGHYLIKLEKDTLYYLITNTDTLGPLQYQSNMNGCYTYNKVGNPAATYCTYYKSNKIGQPLPGEDIGGSRHPETEDPKHDALAFLQKDSIAIYIDDNLITKVDTLSNQEITINGKEASPFEAKRNYFDSRDWLSFSKSGNAIFSLENKLKHNLYIYSNSTTWLVNGSYSHYKVIDTSANNFYQTRINNKGYYIYAKGRKPYANEGYKYSYMFFLHTPDSVFGSVRTAWNGYLLNNGGYYYQGDDDGPDFILINNHMYKNIDGVNNITLIDKKNYLFTYKKDGQRFVVANNATNPSNYKEIFYPTMNADGNYAYYGLRDYYLYKNINGVEVKQPITKYGVRPMPLYISPTGQSLHLFKTEDSTYIYRDDKKLFSLANSTNFACINHTDFLPRVYEKDKPSTGNSLFYLEIDTVGYAVFNGTFSKPLKPVKDYTYERNHQVGEIIAGSFTENNFYFIQKIGYKKYLININNVIYKEINGIDDLLYHGIFFNDRQLVFYGVESLKIYKYTLWL